LGTANPLLAVSGPSLFIRLFRDNLTMPVLDLFSVQ